MTLRGKKVVIDRDLAELYGVTTSRLNEQIKRNMDRFPEDFMFQLDKAELENLMSQFATSKGRGGVRKLPYAFTEHGAIMAASVLNSERAVAVSVYVVRAFVRLREIVGATRELDAKLNELERRVTGHDDQIKTLVAAIKQLMTLPVPEKKGKMGF